MLEQTNVEIGPVETDLLSEIDDEPTVRSEHPEELDAEGNCELVFESMNDMFPALERNGTEIRNNLYWDFRDQTSAAIANNASTR